MKKKEAKQKNTVIYVRVSTDDQADNGHSLEYQLMVCRDKAKILKSQNIIEFTDDGYSGTSLKRPAIKSIISMIRENQVSDLIFYDIDRLSRNVSDLLEIFDLAKTYKVNIHGINFASSMETADDRLMVYMKSVFSQHESEKISERTIKGLIGGMEKGRYTIANLPFGYRRYSNPEDEEDSLNGTLVPVPEELELVERIFRMYTELLLSTDQIAFVIQNDTKSKFKSSKVGRILRNERYTGVAYFHGKYYDNLGFIPIITRERYEVAQDRMDACFKYRKYDYLFYKKLICSCCGSVLISSCSVKKGQAYLYYACSQEGCNLKRKLISEKKVLEQLGNKILRLYNRHMVAFHNNKKGIKKIHSLSEIQRPDLVKFIVEHFKKVVIKI